jgi:hypothetical protein
MQLWMNPAYPEIHNAVLKSRLEADDCDPSTVYDVGVAVLLRCSELGPHEVQEHRVSRPVVVKVHWSRGICDCPRWGVRNFRKSVQLRNDN